MTDISRSAIPLSDAQIEARFDELSIALTVDDLAFISDSIAEWRVARFEHWSDPGDVTEDTPTEWVVDGAQAYRGQSRRTVAIVDLGVARAIYGFDR